MKSTYYSNGKLLITAEYTVLDGATALALPTKTGQNLVIEPGPEKSIDWTSYDSNGSIWFKDTISFATIRDNEYKGSNNAVRDTLIKILHEASLLNSIFIEQTEGHTITTHLTFPKLWGLGTSSTLINNIAQWLNIDAFTLLKNSFGGSGYDIACAQHDNPITYRLENGRPIVNAVDFDPSFSECIYFVYLNKKQSSKSAIAGYYNKGNDIADAIPVINEITAAVINSRSASHFALLLETHEGIMSGILEMLPVKNSLFPDFNGVIKSLGGWGGDFVLVVSQHDPTNYFVNKGYRTVIPYKEMIL